MTAGGDWRPTTRLPDLVGAAGWDCGKAGHLRATGLVRQVRVTDGQGTSASATAWGLSLGAHVGVGESAKLCFSASLGEGNGKQTRSPGPRSAKGERRHVVSRLWVREEGFSLFLALILLLLFVVQPLAFDAVLGPRASLAVDAFVCLTAVSGAWTVGWGWLGASIVTLEGLIGQLYPAILIARLVTLQIPPPGGKP